MVRNFDITTLRSFVAVAETGGVTKAAGFLHLTQSAVSMQLKRMEEALDVALLDRSGRTVALTADGEQLFAYAKKMVELNDEAWRRLTANEFEGEITLGVPHDIIHPYIPPILKRFAMRDAKRRVIKDHPIDVFAKTGTLNFVSTLAGYMTARDGTEMAFAIFAANEATRRKISKADREAPPGARSWNRRAKAMQQQLIERWGTLYGS